MGPGSYSEIDIRLVRDRFSFHGDCGHDQGPAWLSPAVGGHRDVSPDHTGYRSTQKQKRLDGDGPVDWADGRILLQLGCGTAKAFQSDQRTPVGVRVRQYRAIPRRASDLLVFSDDVV
jgi:hypothetical protein